MGYWNRNNIRIDCSCNAISFVFPLNTSAYTLILSIFTYVSTPCPAAISNKRTERVLSLLSTTEIDPCTTRQPTYSQVSMNKQPLFCKPQKSPNQFVQMSNFRMMKLNLPQWRNTHYANSYVTWRWLPMNACIDTVWWYICYLYTFGRMCMCVVDWRNRWKR